MNSKTFCLLVLVVFLILFTLAIRQNYFETTYLQAILNRIPQYENRECLNYQQKCNRLFIKLRYPNQSLIIRPPLKMPPADLMDRFTQNGDMPLTKEFYFNDVYSDSDSGLDLNLKNETKNTQQVTTSEFNQLVKNIENKIPVGWYGRSSLDLEAIMSKYANKIKSKSMVVIGTIMPWVEAIAYHLTSSQITTLDYTRKQYESKGLEWIHVNDFLDDLINNKRQIELFDNSASFSSIEHSGLGRYGDPLSPEGDIEAVQQVHCLLKPKGLFFLGLPTTSDDSSFIEFNAHRFYGSKRLKLLFDGWNKIDQVNTDAYHSIFVLEKNSVC